VQSDEAAVAPLEMALLEHLRRVLGVADLAYRRRPSPLGGGRFSSLYAFELTPAPEGWTGSFVVRLVEPAEQVRLEVAFHDLPSAEASCTPRLLSWETALADLGLGCLVMERLPGRTYLRGVEPWRFALDLPKLALAWPRRFPDALDALARVDPDEASATLLQAGVPQDLARPGRHLRAVSAGLADEPTLAGVIDWLHDNRPAPPDRLSLVHGDLWPGNVFMADGGVRLIDWTRGGIDDPALDVGFAKVGFALMPEPFPPPPPIRQLVAFAGRSIAARISARCDHRVGGADRVRYYEALRCAVELTDVVAGRASGARPGWEHGVPALVRHLALITNRPIAFR
jgi:aminoglycoside phosphotransferase (APT) family kinase protein